MGVAMSRGLGRVEQELLHEIEINPQERTVVAPFGMDPTKAEARRRAARNLNRKGLAVLRKTEANGVLRSKSLLLSAEAAAEWDDRESSRKIEKAREARRRAARAELKVHESSGGTSPYRRSELRVAIQRVSGDPMTADLLLSELEASLGDAWRLDVLGERNGTAQIRVILDEE